MNTTTLHTANTPTNNPYRAEAFVETCVVCGNAALLGCPRCGRTFCELHASVSGACADCELELSSRTRKVVGPAMVAYILVAAVPVFLMAQATMYHIAVFTTGLLMFGGAAAGRRAGPGHAPQHQQALDPGGQPRAVHRGRRRRRPHPALRPARP